jgi:hypothetical protein
MASDDIASVSELLDAAARADGRRPLSDHLYLDLVNGGLDGFAGFLASEPGHDHPVAYAQISRGNDAHAFEIVIHPHHRYEMATIGPELIEAALDVVASDGGGRVNWWVFEPTSAHVALADAAHHPRSDVAPDATEPADRHGGDRRRPAPSSPDSTTRRGFSVNNRAFAGHGEQGGWTIETFSASAGVVVRSRGVPRPRRRRRRRSHADGRLLLDEGASGDRRRRGDGRDLRDRRGPRLPRDGGSEPSSRWRASITSPTRASAPACCTSTPTTHRR